MRANNTRFPMFAVRAGRLDGNVILEEGRTTLDGSVDARGLQATGMSLARLTANAKLVNGSGQVRALLAGRRGAAFEFSALANVTPDRVELTGKGSVERRALVLNQAAVHGNDVRMGNREKANPRRLGTELRASRVLMSAAQCDPCGSWRARRRSR